VNQNFNQLQGRYPGLGCWLFILGAIWLLGAIGIGGIIKSIFALILFVVLAPVLAFMALQFWIKRNFVSGNCPVCDQSVAGLKNTQISCLNCGTELSVSAEGFERFAADGIIDIQAVDIQAVDSQNSSGDLSDASAATIDVEVERLPEGDR
jgi:ribosomal protein S27E